MGEIRDYMEEMQKKKGREMEQNGWMGIGNVLFYFFVFKIYLT